MKNLDQLLTHLPLQQLSRHRGVIVQLTIKTIKTTYVLVQQWHECPLHLIGEMGHLRVQGINSTTISIDLLLTDMNKGETMAGLPLGTENLVADEGPSNTLEEGQINTTCSTLHTQTITAGRIGERGTIIMVYIHHIRGTGMKQGDGNERREVKIESMPVQLTNTTMINQCMANTPVGKGTVTDSLLRTTIFIHVNAIPGMAITTSHTINAQDLMNTTKEGAQIIVIQKSHHCSNGKNNRTIDWYNK